MAATMFDLTVIMMAVNMIGCAVFLFLLALLFVLDSILEIDVPERLGKVCVAGLILCMVSTLLFLVTMFVLSLFMPKA